MLVGCTGLEPVASGVTVGPELLAGGSPALQIPGAIRSEGLRSALTLHTVGEFRSPLGTPVVRTPEAREAESIRFLTVRQVAEALQISRATVYKAVASGSIPHVRVSNAIRIPFPDGHRTQRHPSGREVASGPASKPSTRATRPLQS